MKNMIKIGLSIVLGLGTNFAHADPLPQRFEGCTLSDMKVCLFNDGTSVVKFDNSDNHYDYGYYTFLENSDKFPNTTQILLTSAFKIPAFGVYAGKIPSLAKNFQLTILQLDSDFSRDEIFIDGKKLDFNFAKSNPTRANEYQFNFPNFPQEIILKKFVKDKLYYTYTYKIANENNELFIRSHHALSSGDFYLPISYKQGQIAMDFGKFSDKLFPFVTPQNTGKQWQEFSQQKAIQQRIEKNANQLYVDKQGFYAYQRNSLELEEIEPKLTEAQSAQLSLEIDEKLKNVGLIKLDFLAPTKTESAVK